MFTESHACPTASARRSDVNSTDLLDDQASADIPWGIHGDGSRRSGHPALSICSMIPGIRDLLSVADGIDLDLQLTSRQILWSFEDGIFDLHRTQDDPHILL